MASESGGWKVVGGGVVVVAVLVGLGLIGKGPVPWLKSRYDALQSETAYKAGKYEEAHALAVVAARDDPNYAEAHYRKGRAEAKLGEPAAAVASYTRCLELDGNCDDALAARAGLYSEAGDHEKAIADYERAVGLKPDNATTRNNYGCALSKAGRHADALAQDNRAVELKPGESIYWVNRGYTKKNLMRYDEALADFDEGLRLDPNAAHGYAGRAGCRFRMKQTAEGKADLDDALARDANCLPALRLRAAYHESRSEYDLACRDLVRVIEQDPSDLTEQVRLMGLMFKAVR